MDLGLEFALWKSGYGKLTTALEVQKQMAKFRFSLEQVLRYRQQLEEQAMLEFSRARAARDARRLQAGEYEARLFAQQTRLSNAASLGEQERWLISGYMAGLRQDLEQARKDLVLLEEELDRCQAELVQKAQDRKLLEKLKANQAERHLRAEAQREQRDYDEIATLRFTAQTL
jgi:flagellar FliJ protein